MEGAGTGKYAIRGFEAAFEATQFAFGLSALNPAKSYGVYSLGGGDPAYIVVEVKIPSPGGWYIYAGSTNPSGAFLATTTAAHPEWRTPGSPDISGYSLLTVITDGGKIARMGHESYEPVAR